MFKNNPIGSISYLFLNTLNLFFIRINLKNFEECSSQYTKYCRTSHGYCYSIYKIPIPHDILCYLKYTFCCSFELRWIQITNKFNGSINVCRCGRANKGQFADVVEISYTRFEERTSDASFFAFASHFDYLFFHWMDLHLCDHCLV